MPPQVNIVIPIEWGRSAKKIHMPKLAVQCLFFAFVCPSADVTEELNAAFAALPKKYIAYHFRGFGDGLVKNADHVLHKKVSKQQMSNVNNNREKMWLGALKKPIPNILGTNATFGDHARYIDVVLTKRCDELARNAELHELIATTSHNMCRCKTRFQTFLLEGFRMCESSQGSRAACFPAFFTTDLVALGLYVAQAMTRWLVVSAGGPYHFVSKQKKKTH